MPSERRSREDVVLILRRAGYPDLADAATKTLPDPVDLDEVTGFLAPYGVTYSVLTDRLGGSP
jgi:hypothetical protein